MKSDFQYDIYLVYVLSTLNGTCFAILYLHAETSFLPHECQEVLFVAAKTRATFNFAQSPVFWLAQIDTPIFGANQTLSSFPQHGKLV